MSIYLHLQHETDSPIPLLRWWTLDTTISGTDGSTSSVFRAENLDRCCLTCRILAPSTTGSTEPYVATNQFFTINLNCVGALECLADTYVDVCS